MKKLLYTLFAVSIIFSACEEEDAPPTNNNNSSLAIGDTHQGGIIFYLDGLGGGLIAAPTDQSSGAQWGCYGTLISGADGTAIGTGAQNTIDIEAGCSTAGTAADICANLELSGYTDWYLPSKDELYKLYLNRTAVGGFAFAWYWSSTENGYGGAWSLRNYSWGTFTKEDYYYVRAVRAF